LVEAEVCPLSGARRGRACPHAIREWMSRGAELALHSCDMHERIVVDRLSGLRAGPNCPKGDVVERDFERYDGAFRAWAAATARPVAPAGESARCPSVIASGPGAHLRIGWPNEGTRFLIDPDRPLAEQQVRVRVDAGAGVGNVRLLVDGRAITQVGAPFVASWPLAPGEHVLTAMAQEGTRSDPVTIRVE
jgi:hypothetical protein